MHAFMDATNSPGEQSPIFSQLANDADMLELIEYFVTELENRCRSLEAAFQGGNVVEIRTLAHQLKGAAGGYGFPGITDIAGELEATILAGECEVSQLANKVEALIDLCRRAKV